MTSTCSFVMANINASIKIEPRNPEPRSNVTLTLQSYSFNPNNATITWKANGKLLEQGPGKTSITVKTGDVGSASTITVTAELADGSTIEQAVTIAPSSILLVYESPNGYVPKFYEGLSLPVDTGSVSVTAYPSLSDGEGLLPPSSLSFSWYVNGSILKNSSGLGKQRLTFNLDYIRSTSEVRVLVSTPRGLLSEKTITITPHSVMPLIYTYDDVFGTNFTTLVGSRFQTVKDFTFSLEPMYVPSNERKSATYTWFIDGLPSTPAGGRVLTLQPKANTNGKKSLRIDVTGTDPRTQKGSVATEIIFDTR